MPERPDDSLMIDHAFLYLNRVRIFYTTYTEKAFLRALSKTTHKAIEWAFLTILGCKRNKVELILVEKLLGWENTMALYLGISSLSLTLHESDSLDEFFFDLEVAGNLISHYDT